MTRPGTDTAAYAVLAMVAVAFAWLQWLTPFALDNHTFEGAYLSYSDGSAGFSLQSFAGYVAELRRDDNWRMGNLLAAPSSLMWPRWLFAALTGVCVALTAWLVTRPWRFVPAWCALVMACAAMIVALPWRNNLLTGDYALNYLWGGAVALAAVYCGLRATASRRWLPVALVGAVLAGMWHEGMAVPMGAGALMLRFVAGRRHGALRPLYATAITAAAVGALWAACSHVTERAAAESVTPAILTSTARVLADNFLSLALIAVLCVARWRRRLLSEPGATFMCGTALASLAISLLTAYSARTSYWPQLCSLCALGAVATVEVSRRVRVLFAAAGVVILGYVAYAGYYCHKVDSAYTAAVAGIAASESGTVFAEPVLPRDIPVATLGMAPRGLFVEPYTYRALSLRHYPKHVAIVPRELAADLSAAPSGEVSVTPGGTHYMRLDSADYGARILAPGGMDFHSGKVFAIRFDNPHDPAGVYLWLQPL